MAKKILILSASYGDGHNAAARSVRDAAVQLDPGADARVVDLFEIAHPVLNSWMKKGYQVLVRYAPAVWSACYGVFDKPALFRQQMKGVGKLRRALRDLLEKEKPDAIVSTYPVYAHLIAQLYPKEKPPFKVYTVITDSISVCSAWYLTESDLFVVANDETAEVLHRGGVAPEKVKAMGFPVSPIFARAREAEREPRQVAARPKVLYVINTGKACAGPALKRVLALNHVELTITTGRNEALREKLTHELRDYGHRARIFGWTDQMPRLLMSHDLLIGKAGGAMVQESIAARCPMIINQVIPGQEEGNAKLIESLGAGVAVNAKKDTAELVQEAFAENGRVWAQWRRNLDRVSRPDAAMRIAGLVLEKAGETTRTEAQPATAKSQAANFKTQGTFNLPASEPATAQ